MIVLDTNVLSELMRPRSEPVVEHWWSDGADEAATTSAVTVAEILVGLAWLPDGRRKRALTAGAESVLARFAQGILPFDESAARRYPEVMSLRLGAGRPVDVPDGQIAAICLAHGATLATRNVKDFTGIGLEVVDPWAA